MQSVNMGDNMVMLRDKRVTSSILPKNTSELGRSIMVDGNVVVEGAVYTDVLEVNAGPAEFKGAVFAAKEIHVRGDLTGEVYFLKAVGAEQSCVSLLSGSWEGEDHSGARCIYGADVNAPTVKMKNCFVCGSVYGTDVTLENTVVLGGVFASKTAEINSCIVGTFNAPAVKASGVNYTLYPTAFSVEPLAILPGTELWNISLADMGALFNGETPRAHTGKIKIDIAQDKQRTVLTAKDGTQTLITSYSVAGKVLINDMTDYDTLKNHFLIAGAALGTQLQKDYTLPKNDGQSGRPITVKEVASFFGGILQGKIVIEEMSGQMSFDEVRRVMASQ